jgi:predicted regulator of Ras-like GTPase activity (Roadblock/LC7/MglB family)
MAGSAGAREALNELTEVSSQIDAVALLDASGAVIASTFASEETASRVASGALALLEAAETEAGSARAPLSQLVAEVEGGAVFVVRSDAGTIAAVTAPDPTTGLVFYDLKVTLRDTTTAPAGSGGEDA